MATRARPVFRSFTLIELLVVVAIIALLMAILLPSLRCAREKARAAKCGVQLKGLGQGLHAYATEFSGWIPGINTSGVAAYVAGQGRDINALRSPATPVQTYDWMSPALRYETELGGNRAERFRTLVNEYQCPSQAGLNIDFLYPQGLSSSPDRADFTDAIINTYAPLSYLMPAHFQWWGRAFEDMVIAQGRSATGRPVTVYAMVPPASFEAYHAGRYQSRFALLGAPARKVAAADGMRYLTADDEIDFDVSPAAQMFGSFASSGCWWAGSTEYGVRSGTLNWDGVAVSQPSTQPPAQGRNMVWSYRHGCTDRGAVTQGVRDNSGEINAVFFDGHVARLDDRASRNVEYWYPSGAVVRLPGEGLTAVPLDTEIP